MSFTSFTSTSVPMHAGIFLCPFLFANVFFRYICHNGERFEGIIRTSAPYTIFQTDSHVSWNIRLRQWIQWCALNTSTLRGKLNLFWKPFVDVTSAHFLVCLSCAGAGGGIVPTINCLHIIPLFSSSNDMFTWIPLNRTVRSSVLRSISESKRSVCKRG